MNDWIHNLYTGLCRLDELLDNSVGEEDAPIFAQELLKYDLDDDDIQSLVIRLKRAVAEAYGVSQLTQGVLPNPVCFLCETPSDNLAGNPTKWSVHLGNNLDAHIGCVNKMLEHPKTAVVLPE